MGLGYGKLDAAQDEIARLRGALARIQSSEAFYVATAGIDPETFARMDFAQRVLAGKNLSCAASETETETHRRYAPDQ